MSGAWSLASRGRVWRAGGAWNMREPDRYVLECFAMYGYRP